MDRLLLLMPRFMDYEKSLKENLNRKYEVCWLDSDEFDREILDKFYKCNKIRWGIRHLFRKCFNYDLEKAEAFFLENELGKICLEKNYFSVVFCINGPYLSDEFYKKVRMLNPNARYIYYAWDDVSNLIKKNHIRYFDEVYSYDIIECKKNKWNYLPVFVQESGVGHSKEDKYDIVFIGSLNDDRRKIADDLYERYSSIYRLFIYLYDKKNVGGRFCHNSPLTNKQYISIMRESKAILDVPQICQKGPTTRAFDALLTETKVITVNKYMKYYPVYSDNMIIVDRDNINIPDNFMAKEYVINSYHSLSIDMWIKKIGL